MTESANHAADISPSGVSDEAKARIDQLRRGRTDRNAPSVRQKRRHPAQGARIAAGGIGLASMLGLVGAMGYANRTTSPAQPAVAPVPAVAQVPQIVIVIHRATDTTTAGGAALTLTNGAPATSTPASSAAVAAVAPVAIPVLTAAPAAAPAAPKALTATPVVRKAPAAQAPIAKTSGSK